MSKSALNLVEIFSISVYVFNHDIYTALALPFCLVSWFFPIYLPLLSSQTKPELRCDLALVQPDFKRSFFRKNLKLR
jgi:hypothetical protein